MPSENTHDQKSLNELDPRYQEYAPFIKYVTELREDPLRLTIPAAHSFIEETIEDVIASAVPDSHCFGVSKMRFPEKIDVLKRLLREKLHKEFD
jgi:hypothetical protein